MQTNERLDHRCRKSQEFVSSNSQEKICNSWTFCKTWKYNFVEMLRLLQSVLKQYCTLVFINQKELKTWCMVTWFYSIWIVIEYKNLSMRTNTVSQNESVYKKWGRGILVFCFVCEHFSYNENLLCEQFLLLSWYKKHKNYLPQRPSYKKHPRYVL